MGIKTTHSITRGTALEIRMERAGVKLPTNEYLEHFLEAQEESYFRNYSIVEELPDETDFTNVIRNKEQF